MSTAAPEYAAVVIGSGFGGTMTALPLAAAFSRRAQDEKVLMLERGTWWTTPVPTVQDPKVATPAFLHAKGQPYQFWSSAEHFRGFLDIATRCLRRKGNEDGLYDVTTFGRRGLLGLGLAKNDGVAILRACGVGGGSLVYANITIRPPDFVLDDPRWPLTWAPAQRDAYFELARSAIGDGVLTALARRDGVLPVPAPVNTGLSSIATRTARLDPHWAPDPAHPGGVIKRIDLSRSTAASNSNALWLDRARVFQTEMSHLTDDYGTVDSSINDLPVADATVFDPAQPPNYCERQGRCIVGCLPGARHTLNKQLMVAALGKIPSLAKPDGAPPLLPNLQIQALAEVDTVSELADGGYEVRYFERDEHNPKRGSWRTVTAERVIVAAGTVGTNEIMLRSRERGTLRDLSPRLGHGFSTNGDYLAFLEDTREPVNLARGPITTCYAHFHAGAGDDVSSFHTIEDNGIPRAFSTLTKRGLRLLRSLSKGRHPRLFLLLAIGLYVLARIPHFVRALLRNHSLEQDEFASEDEQTMRIMCVAAIGRDKSVGRFRLGRGRDTRLRVDREDGLAFHQDPIYSHINQSLDAFAERLTGDPSRKFINPFLTDSADALGSRAINLSHPLGGCCAASTADAGVTDELGHVFDSSKSGDRPFHEGLYIADGSRIPTALGVNPSLTITALALRTADAIIAELAPVATPHAPPARVTQAVPPDASPALEPSPRTEPA